MLKNGPFSPQADITLPKNILFRNFSISTVSDFQALKKTTLIFGLETLALKINPYIPRQHDFANKYSEKFVQSLGISQISYHVMI